MKTFEVTLERIESVTLIVQAVDSEQAEDFAEESIYEDFEQYEIIDEQTHGWGVSRIEETEWW